MGAVVVALIVFGILVIFLMSYYSQNARIKRALRQAERLAIGEFPDGKIAKVVGNLVFLNEPLIAPLSGRPCAYYDVTVEQYRDNTGNSTGGSWHTIIRETRGIDFMLEDGTGRAIVSVESAETVLTTDHETRSGTFDDATADEEAFLNRHSRESKGWLFNKTIRYREGVLEAGELVAAMGYGSKEPDPEGTAGEGYRDMPSMRVRISGSSQLPHQYQRPPRDTGLALL